MSNGAILVLVKGSYISNQFNGDIRPFSDVIDNAFGLETGTSMLRKMKDEGDAYTMLAYKHTKKYLFPVANVTLNHKSNKPCFSVPVSRTTLGYWPRVAL